MEYRFLGGSGFKVPVLSYGTATFGGRGDFFSAWGSSDVAHATRLVDLCIDAGVTFFDTADVYSNGAAEEILGKAIGSRRPNLLISTKATFGMSDDPNDVGSSRYHLLRSCENSLRRLNTDYIDLYFLHGFDAQTAIDEVLRALDHLVESGKVRYIGCSNFSGWHLMKSLATSDKYGWSRYVAHQAYYSLVGREYEWELMPLALDQKVGTMVWSPLAGGRLGGRFRRNQPIPADSRIARGGGEGRAIPEDLFYDVVDALYEVAEATGKTVPQVAINWVLQRPSVANVVIGARNEEQLQANLGAVGWSLTREQIAKLDAASKTDKMYPYWHQEGFSRNPFPADHL